MGRLKRSIVVGVLAFYAGAHMYRVGIPEGVLLAPLGLLMVAYGGIGIFARGWAAES